MNKDYDRNEPSAGEVQKSRFNYLNLDGYLIYSLYDKFIEKKRKEIGCEVIILHQSDDPYYYSYEGIGKIVVDGITKTAYDEIENNIIMDSKFNINNKEYIENCIKDYLKKL